MALDLTKNRKEISLQLILKILKINKLIAYTKNIKNKSLFFTLSTADL